MHPQITTSVLAAAQQDLLRDAARSRSVAAARDVRRRHTPVPRDPRVRGRLLCWLRATWRRYVDLTSPWGPISASRLSAGEADCSA